MDTKLFSFFAVLCALVCCFDARSLKIRDKRATTSNFLAAVKKLFGPGAIVSLGEKLIISNNTVALANETKILGAGVSDGGGVQYKNGTISAGGKTGISLPGGKEIVDITGGRADIDLKNESRSVNVGKGVGVAGVGNVWGEGTKIGLTPETAGGSHGQSVEAFGTKFFENSNSIDLSGLLGPLLGNTASGSNAPSTGNLFGDIL